MPLSQHDPDLDYDGSWGDASIGWPAIKFESQEAAEAAYVLTHRVVKVPYGSYVLVDKELRLETEEWKKRVEEHLAGIVVESIEQAQLNSK